MNAKTKYDIFISYRREGGFEVAKLIKECLERTAIQLVLTWIICRQEIFVNS